MNDFESMEIEWTPEAFDVHVYGANWKRLHVWRECGKDTISATVYEGDRWDDVIGVEESCDNWSDPVAVLVAVRKIATGLGLFEVRDE